MPMRRGVSDPALAAVAYRVRQSLAQRFILGAQAHDPVSRHGTDVLVVQLVTHQHSHLSGDLEVAQVWCADLVRVTVPCVGSHRASCGLNGLVKFGGRFHAPL